MPQSEDLGIASIAGQHEKSDPGHQQADEMWERPEHGGHRTDDRWAQNQHIRISAPSGSIALLYLASRCASCLVGVSDNPAR